ncbi:MAG: T9SS type A sorting domain-containing protein [Rhodothermales bacterium]
MTLKPLLLFLLLAAAPAAHAQLTLTRSDILGQLSRPTTATSFETGPSSALAVIAATGGANRTWDFSGLSFDVGITAVSEVVAPPVLGSDDPHLAEADLIVRTAIPESDSVAFGFYDTTADALAIRGFAAEGEVDGEPGVVLLRFAPPNRLFAFPLAFGTAWTDTYELQFVPFVEQIRIEETVENEVVGWGTLVTPAGSAEALMLSSRTFQTVRVVSTDPDTSFVVGQDSSYSISFVTRTGLGASIDLDGEGNVESGGYVVQTPTTASEPDAAPGQALLSAYPNPLRRGQTVTLGFAPATAGTVRIEVFDVLGRIVATVLDETRAAGPQQAPWRPDGLPAGLYLVRIVAGDRTETRRVTIVE